MAYARLTALASLLTAVILALLAPPTGGVTIALLIGWGGVVALGLALWFGAPIALTTATVAFVVRLAAVSSVIGPPVPPVWVQVALLVLSIELAVVSMESRMRPRPVITVVGRVILSVGVATVVAVVMESSVYGSSADGLLLRVAAVAATVVLAGWVIVLWGRAVD